MSTVDQLKEPFKPSMVHWRPGRLTKDKKKCIALAYINARDVMKRLDDTLGAENWTDDYEETNSGRLLCRLSVRIDGEWISKTDGAGDTAVEGEKGGISDAFKRAAVKWGIGRYLYYLPVEWVEISPYKTIENPPNLPKWARPSKEPAKEAQASLEGWQ